MVTKTSEITMTEIIPIPEIGLEDEPTNPAIYPDAAAMKKPINTASSVQTTTNNTASSAEIGCGCNEVI